MATDRKAKKDKELENQIRDVRQQLTEQLRCLDQRVDCHLGLVWELQEYYRRHAEVEAESSRGLDKLGKQISARHKAEKQRRELWPSYCTYDMWQTLLTETKNRSREYAVLADIYGTLMVNRLGDLVEDIQRVHRKCRDILTSYQEELIKVLTELFGAMKTYHEYHGDSQHAENKLLRVQSQRVNRGIDQNRSIGRRFRKDYEKESEKKQAKYIDNKLKALKARNDYLLSIDAANAAVKKYFQEDLPLLVEKMDSGYHIILGHATSVHVRTEECLLRGQQARLDAVSKQVSSMHNPADRDKFRTINAKVFAMPETFEFQPHKGDEINQLSAQKTIQDEMIDRLKALKDRLDKEKSECQLMAKSVAIADKAMVEKLSQMEDVDISLLFQDDKLPLKSPIDKDKRNKERIEAEEAYLSSVKMFLRGGNLVSRLQAKYDSLQRAVGEEFHSESADILRPPSLPPKPRKRAVMSGQQPKLFGGSLEEYLTVTGLLVPPIVLSCVKAINLYGMHHQGIFRIPGSQTDINSYKLQFEQGENPLDGKIDGDDINSVAGLFKLYFRELKDSLFPASLFEQLVECSSKYNINDSVQEIEWKTAVKSCVSGLSLCVIRVMRYLFAFLNHVSEYSDENMMDASNLAICFGPTLLPVPTGKDQVQYQPFVNELIKNIIIHYEVVFPFDGELLYEKCIIEDDREKDFAEINSDDDALKETNYDEDDDQAPEDQPETAGIEQQDAVALYDFSGRTKRELTFKKGDVIKLTQRRSVDWWDGVVGGKTGLIPDKYVKVTAKKRKEKESSLKAGVSGGFAMMLDEKLRKSTECLSQVKPSVEKAVEKESTQASVTVAAHSSNIQPISEQSSSSEAHQKSADASSVVSSGQPKEDLASSIDNTLAKVLSGIKTLDRIQQNPGNITAKPSDKSEASSSGTTVPIVVKPPSPTGDTSDSSAFLSFNRSKNKAATLPKESAYVDESMKTFGGHDTGSLKKVVDLRTKSLTYAEGNAVKSAISEHDTGSSSFAALKSESESSKDEDAGPMGQTMSSARSAAPRSGQMPIPAAIPTVPSANQQPPTPSGSTAPLVPPKPAIVKKPAVQVGGTSPQLTKFGDVGKAAALPKK